jgi:hypothetical protein
MMEVRDIVYYSNGMTVAFDDNSVANVVYKIVNGSLTLVGFSAAQQAAMDRFNAKADPSVNQVTPSSPGAASPKVENQLRSFESQIQFLGEPFSGSSPVVVAVGVTDAEGVVITFSNVGSLTVNITGGTATGKQLKVGATLSAVDGSIVVPLVDGSGSVEVLASSAGTVELNLTDSAGSGLTNIDTAVVTVS